MDLEDEFTVNISDIWGRFISPISEASKRYAADSILAGRISQVGEMWQAKLTYVVAGQEQRIELNELSTDKLISSITDNIAELLCEKYCVVEAAERHQIVMQVSNVRNFSIFKQVEKYLSDLSSIRRVNIGKISGNSIQLDLDLLGDISAVKKALSLGNRLVEETKPLQDIFKLNQTSEDSELISEDIDTPAQNEVSNLNENSDLISIAEDIQSDNNKQVSPYLYYRWIE